MIGALLLSLAAAVAGLGLGLYLGSKREDT